MEKEKKQEFILRITQSSRTQLVVVIYEIILAYMDEAKECSSRKDWEGFSEAIERASAFVKELVGALDFQYEIASQLMSLYLYVNRCLIHGKRKKDVTELKGVEVVINGLKDSFQKLSETDASGPVMKNVQEVYEGFTYGRDSKNEIFQQDGGSRGFTV